MLKANLQVHWAAKLSWIYEQIIVKKKKVIIEIFKRKKKACHSIKKKQRKKGFDLAIIRLLRYLTLNLLKFSISIII